MSAESLILVRIEELAREVRGLNAKLALVARDWNVWPERMTTDQAVLYAREKLGRPRFSSRTLRKWRALGLLSRFSPCRWDRAELDRALAGEPVSSETRGVRRPS